MDRCNGMGISLNWPKFGPTQPKFSLQVRPKTRKIIKKQVKLRLGTTKEVLRFQGFKRFLQCNKVPIVCF